MNYQDSQKNGKIKILYSITSLGIGGAEKLLLAYLKNLNTNKFNLFVCCLREKPDELNGEMSEYAEIINLKMRNKYNPFVIFKLIKIIKNIKPDIIHTHLFQPRIYCTIAYLFYQRAVLITQKHSIVNPKKHYIFIYFELLCIFFNKKVIAISQAVKDSLIKYEFISEKKILVLPNCIDYKKFNETAVQKSILIDQDIVIGTVGRIEAVKGIKYLVLAMKTILAKFPNAKLEIVGDGSELDSLKRLSVELGISNSVIFFGKFADVIHFYKRMNIFILPSILEGFGIVLLEAMAAGIPIVATNVDGIKEVVIDMNSGLLVPPKNPQAIAKGVIKLIENSNLTKQLIHNGFARAKLFDVHSHILKLEQLYTNLLGVESSR